MKKLIIINASAFGREVADWATQCPEHGRDWELAGFADDRPGILDGFRCPWPILGSAATVPVFADTVFVCAIGDSRTRLDYALKMKARGAQFITIVHPSVVLGSENQMGEGCIVCPRAVITNHVRIGAFVVINYATTIGHDARLDDGCTLSGHVDVTGWCQVGKGALLGSHACLVPHATIGDYATVGAGSLVLKHVRPGVTVLGVPAKEIFTLERLTDERNTK